MRLKVQKLGGVEKSNASGHNEAVCGVGWLGADEILSAGDDHQILKWNVAASRAQPLQLSSAAGANSSNAKDKFFPTSLRFLPKNDATTSSRTSNQNNDFLLITTTEGKIYLLSASGRIEKIVEAHKGTTLGAKWSADALGFVSCGEDGSVKIWSKGGMLRSVLAQNGRPVYAVDWNPQSTKVAFCVGDECFVKSLKAQTSPLKWKAHAGIVLCLEWAGGRASGASLIATGGEDCRYRIWDELGRPLFSSHAHTYPVTTLAWNGTGELLAVGSHNLLRLCDRAGWSHSAEKLNTGSVYSIAWSADGTQFVAGCADGTVLHAHVIEKRSMWENLEAIQTKRKTVEVRDMTSELASECLETRDRITNLRLGYGHLVVATTKQCYVFSSKTWNTPVIIELKSGQFGSNGVSLIVLCEKYFLLAEGANLVQIFNYEGRLQCQIRLTFGGGNASTVTIGSTGEPLTENTVAMANDVLVVRDRTQNNLIHFFDVITGNTVGDEKFAHTCEIMELAVSQCGGMSERRVAFVDENGDAHVAFVNSYATVQRAEKIGSQTSELCFNNATNMLTGFQGRQLVIWSLPSVVFVDKNLLSNTIVDCGATDNLGKSPLIIGFVGNTITVRRSDGCILAFYAPPYIAGILRCAQSGNWDCAVRICRNIKVKYWATLAGLAATEKNYTVAEICYGQLVETEKVLYLGEIRQEANPQLRAAMMALFNGQAGQADSALVQNGQFFRAIMLNLAMFNFDRALELALKSNTHLDTVLGYRLRYLEQTGRREYDPKFLKHLSQVEIDWPHICEKINQDRNRFNAA